MPGPLSRGFILLPKSMSPLIKSDPILNLIYPCSVPGVVLMVAGDWCVSNV